MVNGVLKWACAFEHTDFSKFLDILQTKQLIDKNKLESNHQID